VKRSRLWLLPLLLAALVAGGFYFDRAGQRSKRELPVYTLAGERMAAGAEIYRRGTDDKPFTYPPFAAVPFVPFAKLPTGWQPWAWFAVNFGIVLWLVRWLHRYAAREGRGLGRPRLVWFWVLTGLVGGRHVVSVFANQSHDLLIAGLVGAAAAAWCGGRAFAGAWAGLGAAIKATPLLFVGLFGLRSRLALVLLLGVCALATVVPDALFPRADGQWWWRAWYDVNLRGLEVGSAAKAAGAWDSHSFLNQSLSGTLGRWFTPVPAGSTFTVGQGEVLVCELGPGALRAVLLAAQALVLALIAVGVLAAGRAVRSAEDRRDAQRAVGLGEVAAIACGMVLLSPQSSKAHFCVWLFPVAFVVDRLLRGRRDLVALLLLAAGAAAGLLAKDVLGERLGNRLLAFGNVTWATVLFLLATVRCLWTTRPRADGQ
jgi:alpha-1,2-mannosyltransferase